MGLTSAILPDTLKIIGVSAFANSGLSQILIPASVTEIGNFAFSNCSGLEEVFIAGRKNILTCGEYAFSGTPSNANIQVSESLVDAYKSHPAWAAYANKIGKRAVTIYLDMDASGVPSSITAYYGGIANLPIPTRSGYDFDGWHMDFSYPRSDYSDQIYYYWMTKSITLYAKWIAHEEMIFDYAEVIKTVELVPDDEINYHITFQTKEDITVEITNIETLVVFLYDANGNLLDYPINDNQQGALLIFFHVEPGDIYTIRLWNLPFSSASQVSQIMLKVYVRETSGGGGNNGPVLPDYPLYNIDGYLILTDYGSVICVLQTGGTYELMAFMGYSGSVSITIYKYDAVANKLKEVYVFKDYWMICEMIELEAGVKYVFEISDGYYLFELWHEELIMK